MNSLFGGGPLGANKQLPSSNSNGNGNGNSRNSSPANRASGSDGNSNNAKVNTATNAKSSTNANAPASSGIGGWGSMFKSALNQVETHLDRYLEVQHETSAVSTMSAGARNRQLAHARSMRSLRQSADSSVSAKPIGLPGASGDGDLDAGLSSASPPARGAKQAITPLQSRSVDDARVRPNSSAQGRVVDVQEDDMDSNLLDAFGIELEGSTETRGKTSVAADGGFGREQTHTKSILSDADTPVVASLQSKARDTQIDAGVRDDAQGTRAVQLRPDGGSEASSTLDSDSTIAKNNVDAAAPPSAENPYIQEELRKLRAASIPENTEGMRSMIEDYSRRIESLLLEGQQWSAKELRLSNTIKKLRVDNKNYEKAMALIQKKLDAAVSRNDDLSEKLRHASLTDRSAADNMKALRARLQETDTQRKAAERELDSLKGTSNALRSALSKAEREASGLHTELTAARSNYSLDLQSAKDEARREAAQQLVDVKSEASASQQRLQAQADELQQRVMAAEEEARDREVSLLTQIRTLQDQLRSTELKSNDRSIEIQQHALPLIQQMEELRARQTEQRRDWMRKESELAERLRTLVQETDSLRAKLDARGAELAEAQNNVAAEAKATENGRQEMARVRQQLQTETKIRSDMKRQLEEAHGNVRRLSAKLDELQSLRLRTSPDLPSVAALSVSPPPQQVIAESPTDRGSAAALLTGRHGRNLSVSSISSTDSRQRRTSAADSTGGPSPQTSDSAAATHAATRKFGAQIASLKAQLQAALKQKNEFSESLVGLSQELEAARIENSQLKGSARELDELKRRHKTALEMLGEKTEQVMELQHDISEMREAYKQQLQSLL
ncbi:hypothetical protein IWW48_003201 [Coemansia sp. RSA 1200]|nr:hypothetical protein IWW48_003201 [Coemansia sp. RSA 1200]